MMNIVIITPRYDNDDFNTFLGPSLNKIPVKCINVADKTGSTSPKSISNKYNAGINIARDKGVINDDTILVFANNNVHILDSLFNEKLSMIFTDRPDVAVVGVVGTRQLNSGRSLYDKDNRPVNGIIYTSDIVNNKGEHIQYSKNGFYDNIVAIDDSIFAMRGSILLNNTNQLFDMDLNQGYGIEIALKSILDGHNIVVADILVVSKNKTDMEFKIIDNIATHVGLSYPINVQSLGKKINSIVDINI